MTAVTWNTNDNKSIDVRIVRSPDEYQMAMAIRAAVFLAEEADITYNDEFDGNDWSSTHVILFVNGDPAGTMRIRWFSGFARFERLGVRQRYRNYRNLKAIVTAAINLARRKGYDIASGKARGDSVVNFWKRQGGYVCGAPEHMHRGILVPILLPISQRSDEQSISPSFLGNSFFEEMLSAGEGEWDLAGFTDSIRMSISTLAAE